MQMRAVWIFFFWLGMTKLQKLWCAKCKHAHKLMHLMASGGPGEDQVNTLLSCQAGCVHESIRPCSNQSHLYQLANEWSALHFGKGEGAGVRGGSIEDKVKVSWDPWPAGFWGKADGSLVADSKHVALSLKWFVNGRASTRQGIWLLYRNVSQ